MDEFVDINDVEVTADFQFDTDIEAPEPDPETINESAPESTIAAFDAMKDSQDGEAIDAFSLAEDTAPEFVKEADA